MTKIYNDKMVWNHDTKEKIQYTFAAVAFVCGLTLIFIAAFKIPPLGVVDPTIVSVFGIILTFIGAIFGISAHYKNELTQFKSEVNSDLDNRISNHFNSEDEENRLRNAIKEEIDKLKHETNA